MKKFEGYSEKHKSRQQYFVYPLLFLEYIYAFAHDYGLNGSEPVEIVVSCNNKKFSSLLVKHLIIRMYQENFLDNSVTHLNQDRLLDYKNYFYSKFYSQILSERFAIVVEIPLSLWELLYQFLHLDYLSHIGIPYPIHLEILVQLLQYRIQDVPSLHLLRFFLNYYSNWNKNKRLSRFLYNSYVSEYEFFCCFFEDGTFWDNVPWFFLENPMVLYGSSYALCSVSRKGNSCIKMHFFLKKKWKCYLINFWQYYFCFWTQPRRIHINQLANSCFDFMGYLSSVPKSSLLVRNQMLENSFLIDTRMKKIRYHTQFCTGSGHPISKPIWTNLSYWDILDRFGRICRNLFHYHSGFLKKRTLYRLKYILRLSCTRTLARKHKITVRTFMQRLGSAFLEEFFIEEEQVFSLMLTKTTLFSFCGSHTERIWYLDIIRINDLVNPLN
ncbi:hypothetical protein VPH35_072958 [Triticum aestivum]